MGVVGGAGGVDRFPQGLKKLLRLPMSVEAGNPAARGERVRRGKA
jgi:hypothetical protein